MPGEREEKVQQLQLELYRTHEVCSNLKKVMSCKKEGVLCEDLKVQQEDNKVEQANTDG
jgi:hypothetical protein